jgi:hypothetical protein
MDKKTFYEIYLLNSNGNNTYLSKVLFYFDDIEYYLEPKERSIIENAFLEKYYEKRDPKIVDIKKIDLPYSHCVS